MDVDINALVDRYSSYNDDMILSCPVCESFIISKEEARDIPHRTTTKKGTLRF